jgi:large subunit ribosomal protein L14e
MYNVGRICIKTAGRDTNKYCIIIEELGKSYVIIDGLTRRKKCNIKHLEPTTKTADIKKDADTKVVLDALKKEGIIVKERKESTKDRQDKQERPKKQKVKREKVIKEKKSKK